MTPWTAQPSAALAMDLRLLVATPEVQALVFRLGHASRGGRVPFATSAETAVRAACGGADWAVTALDAAVEAGFILVEESALVLGWEWPVLAVERPVTATAEPSAASSHAPSVAAALGLTADALRRAAWKFKRRLDRWSVVPSGVTWESVLEPASPWHALLKTDARRTGTVPGHRDGTGTRPDSPTGTVPGRYRDGSGTLPPPSHSPLPQKETEKEAAAQPARGGATVETGTDTGTVPGHRDGTGTHSGTLVLSELFDLVLPQQLIPDGDDTIRRGVGDRIVAAGLATPAGLDAIARALTDPSKVWPDWRAVASKKRRVSLVMLAGSPDPASGARLYSPLGELLAYARASTQRAPSDARTAPSTAPTRPKPRSREEIAEIVRRAQEAGAHGG